MAWLTNRSRASMRRQSAGTRSPAARRTTSPGTSWSTGSDTSTPSRRTWTRTATVRRKASTAFSARISWTKSRVTLSTTITMTITKLVTLPVAADRRAGEQQDEDQRVEEAGQKLQPQRPAAVRQRLVEAVLPSAGRPPRHGSARRRLRPGSRGWRRSVSSRSLRDRLLAQWRALGCSGVSRPDFTQPRFQEGPSRPSRRSTFILSHSTV